MKRRNIVLVAMTISGISACAVNEIEAPMDDPVKVQELIVNGTVPAPGALVTYGVVSLGGCTGTLLTNRHVLTAHHCVRGYSDSTGQWAANANTNMSATLEDGNGNQVAYQSRIFEPPQPWSINAGDYSILELDRPFKISGSTDSLFNPIYSQADSTLLSQNVYCIGYGWTYEATPTTYAGGGMLTSATMTINSVTSNSTFARNRTSANVVGFAGDSGSTCFLNGYVTGVQSTCGASGWYDVNGNQVSDGWAEAYNVQSCTSASPGSFRTWANQQILANVNVGYSFVPELAIGTQVYATISAANQTSADVLVSSPATLTAFAARSGRLDVVVSNEPPNMMCPLLHTGTPLDGAADLTGTCLDDGLVSVLTSPI